MSNRYRNTATKFRARLVGRQPSESTCGPLEVNVIYTDREATSAALVFAEAFARDLGARICLREAFVVPFELPVDCPPIPVSFLQERLRRLVSQIGTPAVEPSIHLYFCRDVVAALAQILKPGSLVVIGGRKHLWSTPETRMAKALRSKGHQVIFIDSKARSKVGRLAVAR
jgi:hypothetical protein